jgi:Fe-S-cluster-containing hydrogenase component 2
MGVDIFQMLIEDSKRRRERRAELLKNLGVIEYFSDGEISINSKICQGIECKLCIKACPTSALYWSYGRVNVVEEVCIYCAACVLSCIVNDCIKVTRKRPDGRIEKFSKPIDVIKLLNSISSKRRSNLVSRVFQR